MSAVSPPVLMMPTPASRRVCSTCSVPAISALSTSPGMTFLFRPIVEESRMLSTQPMHRRSSMFMMTESCAIPRHTLRSPVSFQYIYARLLLVPAPSACMHVHHSGSPAMSGTTLQKARGKRPLSTLAIAVCTSSLAALTPRAMYRSSGAEGGGGTGAVSAMIGEWSGTTCRSPHTPTGGRVVKQSERGSPGRVKQRIGLDGPFRAAATPKKAKLALYRKLIGSLKKGGHLLQRY